MIEKPTQHSVDLVINDHAITTVLIGRHYLSKHGAYMNDELILELVNSLNGFFFAPDSISNDIEYFVADIELKSNGKIYRIIWLFEGENLEVLGVVNAYRRSVKPRK